MIDNEIVTANARTFPLINSTSEDKRTLITRDSEQGMNDPVLARQIDALTPYVDLARMSRERYDRSPSIPNGAKMAKNRNELVARMKRVTDSLCGRYPSATREDVWTEMLKRFPSLKYVFQGEVAHV